ncbi:MAG: hypothetical protein LH478_11725 [Chitinophagaceae bacterium]|nr:hypothetical protein [Chitinophagaceae bacterium]
MLFSFVDVLVLMLSRLRDKCGKGMRSETSIYPVFKVIPKIISTGSLEDTRTTPLVFLKEGTLWMSVDNYLL